MDGAFAGQQMFVPLAMIIVNVRGRHAFAHDIETHFHAFFDMRMAYVEAKTQIVQVCVVYEMLQRSGRAEFARSVFQRDSHAASFGKNAEMFERAEGRIQLARVGGLAAVPDVLHEETEWNSLRYLQRSFYFVHGVETPDAFGIRNRYGYAAFASGRKIAFRRRMQGVQLQTVFAKRVGQFTDRLWLAVVEMPRRAEYFNAGDSSLGNLSQQCSAQRLVDIAISRKYPLHSAPVQFVVKNYYGRWKMWFRQ